MRSRPETAGGIGPDRIYASGNANAPAGSVMEEKPNPLMKNIISIIIIAVGIFVFVQGLNRKDSVVGAASTVGTDVANAVDGGARTPKHVIYMVVGGVLVVVGIAGLARKSPAV
jgi:uncharacterized membrane protein YidH (DUF202 family)